MAEREVFGRFLRRRKILSPLRYPGGRRRLVPYIAATLAANELRPDLFVEAFAGGASVSLELLDADLVGEVALGDAGPMVAAFWRSVFEDTDWLCRQVETVPLDLATWERMKVGRWRSQRSLALACLYLNRTSFNGACFLARPASGGCHKLVTKSLEPLHSGAQPPPRERPLPPQQRRAEMVAGGSITACHEPAQHRHASFR